MFCNELAALAYNINIFSLNAKIVKSGKKITNFFTWPKLAASIRIVHYDINLIHSQSLKTHELFCESFECIVFSGRTKLQSVELLIWNDWVCWFYNNSAQEKSINHLTKTSLSKKQNNIIPLHQRTISAVFSRHFWWNRDSIKTWC